MSANQGCFMVYTRQVDSECYPEGLAHSIHMAYRAEDGEFYPLNKNYGMLFAKAEIAHNQIICPKGVKDPGIFTLSEGCFGIAAVRTNEDGREDESCTGTLLLWKTEDFIKFEHMGLVEASEIEQYDIKNTVEVDEKIWKQAVRYWTPITSVSVKVPECIEVQSRQDVENSCVEVIYSDGSVSHKKVDWNLDGVDFLTSGEYIVNGMIRKWKYPFPLAKGYGDPVLFFWEDKWYYISTNDNLDDIGLYVREADTVEGLFEKGITEHLILPYDEPKGFMQTFWAPEFHVIGEELYILFAVSGKVWGPQCHLMKLKRGQSIIKAESWEDPIHICKKDGSWLTEDGITLDMTYVKTKRASYMVWSYRKDIGAPTDTGSMLYIATIDEKEPWILTSDPVLLSRPLFGWENVDGTINNEGPYAFVKNDTVFLSYSGGSANGYTYAVGLLTAKEEDDLLDVSVWSKRNTPVLSFYSVAGEYGPGHNSFYINEEGELMIAYHAETGLQEHLRCDGIRRIHFRKDGTPDFELSSEQDLQESLRCVKTKLVIKPE